MSSRRQYQIAEFLREEISEMMQRELRDPRLGLASITRVEMSPDLRYAKVFVSVLGSDDEREDTIRALSGAAGYVRHLLKPRMHVRHVPEIHFVSDRSLQHAEQIARTLNKLKLSQTPTETTTDVEAESTAPPDDQNEEQVRVEAADSGK